MLLAAGDDVLRLDASFVDYALIALYFASSGAEAGDLGIVDQVVLPEWKSHVAAKAELPVPDLNGQSDPI